MPAGVAETDDFFPMARATAAGTSLPRRTGPCRRQRTGAHPLLESVHAQPRSQHPGRRRRQVFSAMIGRASSQAGYQGHPLRQQRQRGLQQLEQRPVSVLLADWLMPEMDGLERPPGSANWTKASTTTPTSSCSQARRERPRRGLRPRRRRLRQQGRDERATGAAHLRSRPPVQHPATVAGGKPPAHRKHRADGRTQPGGYPHRPRQSRYLRQKLADSLRQVETRGGALCCWSACPRHRSCASGTARPSIASCCCSAGACNSWSGRWMCWCAWTSSISP